VAVRVDQSRSYVSLSVLVLRNEVLTSYSEFADARKESSPGTPTEKGEVEHVEF
jgi:hypothetical protein